MDISLILSSILIFALLSLLICPKAPKACKYVLGIVPLGAFFYLCSLIPIINHNSIVTEAIEWIPTLGINISFYIDGLSLLFALLITGIGFFVVLFAGSYMEGNRHLDRFYFWLFLFMGSMLGIVVSNNLFTLFVFWELTSLTSYFLIGFNHEHEKSRSAALQALLVTATGGLAMLAGFILLASVSGTTTVSELLAKGDIVRHSHLYTPILLLVLVGAFTKSAQVPFHFWLPNAMVAPTPVSAYLHSATMVKAGIFLLARMSPTLGGTPLWTVTVTLGTITMVTGACIALGQSDMKKILAYTTVSALGTLTLLIGLGTNLAIKAAIVYLIAHALYKGAFFMVVGNITHGTGIRSIDGLGGLYKRMPITLVTAILAGLSMAGIPPALSFIGKELLFETSLAQSLFIQYIPAASVLSFIIVFILAFTLVIKPFFTKAPAYPNEPHEGNWPLWIGAFILGISGLVFGFYPEAIEKWVVNSAIYSVRQIHISSDLALWHGYTMPFYLTIVTFTLGYLGFLNYSRVASWIHYFQFLRQAGPDKNYHRLLSGFIRIASWQTRKVQNGYLRYYIMTILGTIAVVLLYPLLTYSINVDWNRLREILPHEWALAVIILGGALLAIVSKSRLTSIIGLGVVGYGVSLVYLLFGAVDLAITQILVETLTVILFVFAFYNLPRFDHFAQRRSVIRHSFFAILTGCIVTLLVLITVDQYWHEPISTYFADYSLVLGYGQNVVNVILVDFRSLDTLGESIVLAIAALGIFAMTRLHIKNKNQP